VKVALCGGRQFQGALLEEEGRPRRWRYWRRTEGGLACEVVAREILSEASVLRHYSDCVRSEAC